MSFEFTLSLQLPWYEVHGWSWLEKPVVWENHLVDLVVCGLHKSVGVVEPINLQKHSNMVISFSPISYQCLFSLSHCVEKEEFPEKDALSKANVWFALSSCYQTNGSSSMICLIWHLAKINKSIWSKTVAHCSMVEKNGMERNNITMQWCCSDGGGTDDDHGNQSDGDCGRLGRLSSPPTTNSFLAGRALAFKY